MSIITESEVEQVVLDILHEIGYKIIYGPDLSPQEVQGDISSDGPNLKGTATFC